MKDIILGIDTGGTYTDGVLINCNTREIIRSSKAFTTKQDLTIGITECIDNLKIDPTTICLVCLSTTLATNAVVEGTNTKVGLIVIGDRSILPDSKEYPAEYVEFVSGNMDVVGRETKEIDREEIISALKKMQYKIETLAISGFASVRNPVHELKVKEIAEQMLNVPVVCGHELTSSLGFYERTVTTALNANLIPLIGKLIEDAEIALKERNIEAPVTIVKGDGHFMLSSYARKCPIETVLSGPAASVTGGRFLTDVEDAVIVDMGGTTTDIVCVDNCEAVLEKDGMNIEGWKTRIRSVKVNTFGLGGDSYIRINKQGELTFGPQKVKPICVAADEYPYLCDELKTYRLPNEYLITERQPCDIFYLLREESDISAEKNEMEIIEKLHDGPHSALKLAHELNTDIDALKIKHLLEKQVIGIISFTPTDLLHACGAYCQWNREASQLAAGIIGEKLLMDKDVFINRAGSEFTDKICRCIMESVIEQDGLKDNINARDASKYIFDKERNVQHYRLGFEIERPIVGIGAPAGSWLKMAAERLNATFIMPEYCNVANAVGAAVGDVRERTEAVICYDQFLKNYVLYLPEETIVYDSLEVAKSDAAEKLLEYTERFAEKLGIINPEIDIDSSEFEIRNIAKGEKTFVKSTLSANIKGNI